MVHRMITRAMAAGAAVVILGAGLIAPAHAYDRELYTYGAALMVGYSDIPTSLKVKRGGRYSAAPDGGTRFLCGDEQKSVEYPAGKHVLSVSYEGRDNSSGLDVSIDVYPSNKQASSAFSRLRNGLRSCAGAASGQETYGDGSIDNWSRSTTTGNVPLVTGSGIMSVFMNKNYEDVITGEDADRYTSDSYNVYSLSANTIITTSRYSGSVLNIPTAERRAVNQVARKAVSRFRQYSIGSLYNSAAEQFETTLEDLIGKWNTLGR